jgi:serine/threonine-protein kinase
MLTGADTEPGEAAGDRGQSHDGSSQRELFGRAGALIGSRYRLETLLGTGAMGEVWRARHEELDTVVAIKLANRAGGLSEGLLERFRFEAQVSAQLGKDSGHVVAVHDAGRHRSVPFLAMEYVPGTSLERLLEQTGPLAPTRLAAMIDQLAEALAAAHARGILHRDIKPANVLVTSGRNGSDLVKLADFGIAKALGRTIDLDMPRTTQGGVLVGTPVYVSPEQVAGAVLDERSDLWSLGVCAYEALTGVVPFESDDLTDLLLHIAARKHAPPSEHAPLAPAIDAWFERALAKKARDRFASAAEMAAAFRAAVEASAARHPRRRWPLAVAVSALALGAAAVAWWPREQPATAGTTSGLVAALPALTTPVVEPLDEPAAAPAASASPDTASSATSAPRPRFVAPPAAPSTSPSSEPKHDYDPAETF